MRTFLEKFAYGVTKSDFIRIKKPDRGVFKIQTKECNVSGLAGRRVPLYRVRSARYYLCTVKL